MAVYVLLKAAQQLTPLCLHCDEEGSLCRPAQSAAYSDAASAPHSLQHSMHDWLIAASLSSHHALLAPTVTQLFVAAASVVAMATPDALHQLLIAVHFASNHTLLALSVA
jgi:hypothetical protein